MQNQNGQNLLEITIALGVATVIIAALAITTIKSLSNSQFSKNQVQATKLAQEGMEIVKTIRFRNYPVCIADGDNDGEGIDGRWDDIWNNTFGKLTDQPACTTCKFIIRKDATCDYAGTELYSLWPNPNTNPESIKDTSNPSLTTIFNRQIYLEDYAADQKKITSEVTWTDLFGPHKSQITSIQAKY